VFSRSRFFTTEPNKIPEEPLILVRIMSTKRESGRGTKNRKREAEVGYHLTLFRMRAVEIPAAFVLSDRNHKQHVELDRKATELWQGLVVEGDNVQRHCRSRLELLPYSSFRGGEKGVRGS
jgi:hypothetical protein